MEPEPKRELTKRDVLNPAKNGPEGDDDVIVPVPAAVTAQVDVTVLAELFALDATAFPRAATAAAAY